MGQRLTAAVAVRPAGAAGERLGPRPHGAGRGVLAGERHGLGAADGDPAAVPGRRRGPLEEAAAAACRPLRGGEGGEPAVLEPVADETISCHATWSWLIWAG